MPLAPEYIPVSNYRCQCGGCRVPGTVELEVHAGYHCAACGQPVPPPISEADVDRMVAEIRGVAVASADDRLTIDEDEA
jgi:hypothetical protein